MVVTSGEELPEAEWAQRPGQGARAPQQGAAAPGACAEPLPRSQSLTIRNKRRPPAYLRASSCALASCKSAVSNPSVNQP